MLGRAQQEAAAVHAHERPRGLARRRQDPQPQPVADDVTGRRVPRSRRRRGPQGRQPRRLARIGVRHPGERRVGRLLRGPYRLRHLERRRHRRADDARSARSPCFSCTPAPGGFARAEPAVRSSGAAEPGQPRPHARPRASPAPPVPVDEASPVSVGWRCPACTRIAPATLALCPACGTPAPALGAPAVPTAASANAAGGSPDGLVHVETHPARLALRRRARVALTVSNHGAEPRTVWLLLTDPDGLVVGRAVPDALRIAPGGRADATATVRARRPRLGAARTATVTVAAVPGPDDGPAPDPSPLQLADPAAVGRLRVGDGGRLLDGGRSLHVAAQLPVRVRPLVPRLLAAVALVGVAAPVGLSLARSDDRATVPSLVGLLDAAGAERALERAGLALDPAVERRPDASVPPGVVLAQDPADGTALDRGGRVRVTVAVGERLLRVPSVIGLRSKAAEERLRDAGLTLGPARPRPQDGGEIVASQLPSARQRAAVGTPVAVFLRPALRGGTARATASATPTSEEGIVPSPRDQTPTSYAAEAAQRGLVPKVIRVVRTGRPGRLVGVEPAAGTARPAGATVRLLVTAGVPRLAFDTGSAVRVLDTVAGRTTAEAAPSAGDAVEPAWTPGGRRLVYRIGRRLLLTAAGLSDRGRVLYDGPLDLVTPAFAPTPAGDVLAVISRRAGDGDLCFARVGSGRIEPACLRDDTWDLGRQISWRRDGKELLVFGVRRGERSRFGLLRFRTSRAFSVDPAAWTGRIATDVSSARRGVIAGAYSPSGKRVALVTNVGLPRFQLVVTPARRLRDVTTEALPVRACEVAWRPDGREVAVVQSDSACQEPLGTVARVDVARPRRVVVAATGGRHPAYQPLQYRGPRGGS
ncbi:PASTA domain-containing protein [Conexibacter sp. W3-3-2]|nr:PASTA domain-containing protein [Conexibacter sp. W3-3-2]